MASFNTQYSKIKSYNQRFGDFLGVDYFNERTNVAYNRATEMSNFIHKDGCNQKRNGYTQIAEIYDKTTSQDTPLSINGLWTITTNYKDELGKNIVWTIIHAGTTFFGYKNGDLTSKPITLEPKCDDTTLNYKINRVKNEKSFGVIKGNRLYILCGVYLVFGSWDNGSTFKLKLVENASDTYIPTTTIGIAPENSGYTNQRTSLDEPNLLSNKRINRLIGTNINVLPTFINPAYYISSYGMWKNKVGVKFKITDETANPTITAYIVHTLSNDEETLELTITNSYQNYSYINPYNKGDANFEKKDTEFKQYLSTWLNQGIDSSAVSELFEAIVQLDLIYDVSKKEISIYIGFTNGLDDTFRLDNISINGNSINQTYILDAPIDSTKPIYLNGKECNSNHIILYENNENMITFVGGLASGTTEGESNNEVAFTTTLEQQADLINDCRFGKIFEYNQLQQLFVSGNPNYHNYDWHTSDRFYNETQEFTISEYEDLTYFGSESFYMLGEATHKIVGYSQLGDNTLAIHKEFNPNEPNLYIRTPKIVTIKGIDDVEYSKLEYSQTSTAISEGAINYDCMANLFNDKLFLSKNGLFSVQLSQNLKTDQRYAVERSTLVNNRLTKENLENATAIVFENRYYLSIGNGKVYIADSRFRTRAGDDLQDTLSYEFWIWDNVPAHIWFIKDNKLGFGTKDGKICIFDDNESYVDKTYIEYPSGYLTTTSNGTLIYNRKKELIESGDIIQFTSSIYKELFTYNHTDDIAKSYFTTDILDFKENILPNEDKIVKVEGINEIADAREYTLTILDYENYVFCLVYEEEIFEIDKSFTIYAKCDEEEVFKVEGNEIIFKNRLAIKDSGLTTITAKKIINKKVEAYWEMPVTCLNSPNCLKKIFYLTVVPNIYLNSLIEVEYKTRKSYGSIEKFKQFDLVEDKVIHTGGATYLDFEDVNFNSFTVDTNMFETAYNQRKVIGEFNYIQFAFRSNNQYNCSIKEMLFEYRLTRRAKGVK